MSLCDSLTDRLGGVCTMVGNTGLAFELLNMRQGLSFQGRKFGDERWNAKENAARNVCLLAVHGDAIPTDRTLVLPTTESSGACCALERSNNGNYWWDSCHMEDSVGGHHHGGVSHCTNTEAQKNCLNFEMLAPGDRFSSQISTGAICYDPKDDDGAPYRLECHFSEWPAKGQLTISNIPQPPAPAPPPKASVCDTLTTTLGATCSPLYSSSGKASFELVNLKEGLSYGGLKLGDEHWGSGENSPRNLCMLAAYGGTMPSQAQEIVIPTTDSYAQCCAAEKAINGQYWFESCSINDGTSHAKGDWRRSGRVLCESTPSKKQCINYQLLQPSDEWAATFGTGATCYSDEDDDGTPFRLECHFDQWPVTTTPRLPPAGLHAPPPSPRVASICDELQTNLNGACSPIGTDGRAFELINVQQGLSYGGLKFGDEHWNAGENSPRNLCLLAAYGGVMPLNIVQPTTQSFGTCCAIERSTQGSYWFESCSIGDGESNAHGSRDADGNYRPGETLVKAATQTNGTTWTDELGFRSRSPLCAVSEHSGAQAVHQLCFA